MEVVRERWCHPNLRFDCCWARTAVVPVPRYRGAVTVLPAGESSACLLKPGNYLTLRVDVRPHHRRYKIKFPLRRLVLDQARENWK